MKFNKFSKGSGVYTCKCCGRKTRDTGDGTGVDLCGLCYDLAGFEILINDSTSEVTIEDLGIIIAMVKKLYEKEGAKRVWDDLIRTVIRICGERHVVA